MKKIIFSAALMLAAAISFAGTPKSDAKSETPTPAKTEAGAEQKEFYIKNDLSRLDDEYPTLGPCDPPSAPENMCHATFTRANTSAPWVIVPNTAVAGDRP